MFNTIHIIAGLVCVLLVAGVICRRNKRVHIPLMLSAILIDLGIVVWIEFFGKGAFKQAEVKMGSLMITHIVISVVVLILYGVQIWSGIKKARGGVSEIHRKMMIPTVGLRILNYVTSIMVMGID